MITNQRIDLILIEAPFQLLCALEYIKSHENTFYDIVFIETNSIENSRQISDLVIFFELDNKKNKTVCFSTIPRVNALSFVFSLFVRAWRYKRNNYNQVIIGDYRSTYARIIESRLKQDCIILDDGIALVNSYSAIVTKKVALFKETFRNKLLSKLIRSMNKNYSLYSMLPPNYLTQLSVEGEQLSVEKNSFKYLTSLSCCLDDKDLESEVMIIGNPVTELNMITQDVFESCIFMLIKKYKGKEIIYIAHRRDSENKLTKLEEKFDIKIKRFKRSLEIELICNNLKPAIFYTFSSAALYTVSLLSTSSKCYYFNLESSQINKKYVSSFHNIYKLLDCRAEGVRVEK